ncbi:N-acetyl-gamma-glutamyl-phosphate reductase [Lysobacter arseniciresistens ZS79]|uniref:N-acetyl-gamma-glutamyl-phosphate reductase n=1 Tax=Lysobacter arseniciresistens ZS79 TaxID=913325 RepID=A0A0A0EY02_9GAMM|nr:N-acetyl-gamma-glutamyl-phosphate reductase [Lysobacter arseniciresistens]KGM55364.1 N-acetyl-gamma-glutamyl-phosphate reductase [Lysobacter arseniciresistens ZS79]
MNDPVSLGIVGARGHVGAELIRLVAAHPRFELAFVSSRALDGQRVADHNPDYRGELRYTSPGYDELPRLGADAVVLALPNGKAARCVEAFDNAGSDALLIDLSADYRFDPGWYYGLPELTREAHPGQRRISNPGCYATAMQLALAPMLDVLDGPVQCFGVSGHSGAGTTPSDRNDPDKLRDNLMPYALTGHVHEREVSARLGHPVEFMPHVAPHFRGITVTANLHLSRPFTRDAVVERYRQRYADEPLVQVVDEAPWVSAIAGRHHVEIGGFTLSADGRRLVVVATEDNLLKGAATQALQNLNLAFGLPELTGIPL